MSPDPGGAAIERAAPLFAALADATRLRVVARLCAGGPMSIARLSAGAGVTRQAISRHLQVLADAGLVQCTRRGRESVYQLEPAPLEDARRFLDRISHQWDASLERLRALVED
jgi:DNA-binding transcriptional ArsR family regulator